MAVGFRSNIFGKSGTNYAGDGGGGASCSSVCNISSKGGNGGHGVVMLEYEKKEELIGEFRLISNGLITNHITANSSAENMRRALTEVFDFGEMQVSRSADSGDDGTSWSITFVDIKSPPKLLQSEHTLRTISGRKAKVKITTISTKVEGLNRLRSTAILNIVVNDVNERPTCLDSVGDKSLFIVENAPSNTYITAEEERPKFSDPEINLQIFHYSLQPGMHKRKFKTSPGISCGLGMAKREVTLTSLSMVL